MLRPRFYRVEVTKYHRRFIFALERANGTRKLFSALDIYDLKYPAPFTRDRGASVEVRLFG